MFSRSRRLAISSVLIVAGGLLLLARSDREFLDLRPSEAGVYTTVFASGHEYEHVFTVSRTSLSALGFYFRLLSAALPDEAVMVQVLRGDVVLSEQEIPVVFIDKEGATQVRFDPVISTELGERLRARITIPASLSNKIGWQMRQLDDTFNPDHATSFIDGQATAHPAAYQAYHAERPAIALQLGALAILVAIFMWLPMQTAWQRFVALGVYAAAVAHLYTIPTILVGAYPGLLVVSQMVALISMFVLLRPTLALMPALFGAHLFAFTSWFSLHYIVGRQWHLLAAALPLVVLLMRSVLPAKQSMIRLATGTFSLGIIIFGMAVVLNWGNSSADQQVTTAVVAHPRDVFLDPKQVPDSRKTLSSATGAISQDIATSWDNFGSYIGIPYLIFAVIGLRRARQHVDILVLGLLGASVSLLPTTAAVLAPWLLIPPAHFVIIVTLALSYFAAYGLSDLAGYLGSSDRLVVGIILVIMLLSLLDLFHVAPDYWNTLFYERDL